MPDIVEGAGSYFWGKRECDEVVLVSLEEEKSNWSSVLFLHSTAQQALYIRTDWIHFLSGFVANTPYTKELSSYGESKY